MTSGTVTATSLNLRARPAGAILGSLERGTVVQILEDHGDWLEVIGAGTRGFVSEKYIQPHVQPQASPAAEPRSQATPPESSTQPATRAPALPPEASAADLRVDGKRLLGPGGVVVGTLYKLGLFNRGRVSVADFLQRRPALFAGTSPSLVRVMNAVSENEGALEAINTWDNCFISFGSLQWTAGSGSSAGELGGLLARLRANYPETFETHFGRFGLSTSAPSRQPFALDYSHLRLDGRPLDTPAAKSVLRQPIWAYRFWRAGHDETVCRCEIEHAIGRLAMFHSRPQSALGGRSAADLVSSEFGVALLFDQHTNRPGHVPGTLLQAFQQCTVEGRVPQDVGGWTSAQESVLLRRYLELRHATSMTDSRGRAERLQRAVDAARLSSERGSFTA